MQLHEAHRHRQLNGQESQGLQTRLSRCFFLTKDQDRWTFQLSTIVRISGSSVSLRRNSLMQHNGCMPRQWVFGLIPYVKTTLRVLNIVDAASEMHIAIRNLIVNRWDRWRTMTGICDKWGEFQTMSDELTDAKEQLRMASPAEREMRGMLMRIGGDDPDERSKHGVPRQQDLTQQQPPKESPPQKQHVPPQSSSQPLKHQSRKDPRSTTVSHRTKTTDQT